ncbi:hypothetical protein [Arboricoccus pini]|uniref:hypothetical protein n=1 Tax=Arboricoccus pini TaxID=1963835 RepID=UPI001056115C|nr:hypothetical protein [Arboricoccus pini]
MRQRFKQGTSIALALRLENVNGGCQSTQRHDKAALVLESEGSSHEYGRGNDRLKFTDFFAQPRRDLPGPTPIIVGCIEFI